MCSLNSLLLQAGCVSGEKVVACLQPPDPINHVCSLTGKWISKKCFTYRSVQTFEIMFRRILFSRIWSSAQDHAVLILLLNLVVFSFLPDHCGQVEMFNFVPHLYQFRRGISGGPALEYFYMIHRGVRIITFLYHMVVCSVCVVSWSSSRVPFVLTLTLTLRSGHYRTDSLMYKKQYRYCKRTCGTTVLVLWKHATTFSPQTQPLKRTSTNMSIYNKFPTRKLCSTTQPCHSVVIPSGITMVEGGSMKTL